MCDQLIITMCIVNSKIKNTALSEIHLTLGCVHVSVIRPGTQTAQGLSQADLTKRMKARTLIACSCLQFQTNYYQFKYQIATADY